MDSSRFARFNTRPLNELLLNRCCFFFFIIIICSTRTIKSGRQSEQSLWALSMRGMPQNAFRQLQNHNFRGEWAHTWYVLFGHEFAEIELASASKTDLSIRIEPRRMGAINRSRLFKMRFYWHADADVNARCSLLTHIYLCGPIEMGI